MQEALTHTQALSLNGRKVVEERRRCRFYQGWIEAARAVEFESTDASNWSWIGEAAGESTGNKCPLEKPLREERGRASCRWIGWRGRS